MSIMFISIRSSTGSSTGSATRRRPRCIVTWSLASILPIGQAISQMMAATTASGDREEMGFARAQPILRTDASQLGCYLPSEPECYFRLRPEVKAAYWTFDRRKRAPANPTRRHIPLGCGPQPRETGVASKPILALASTHARRLLPPKPLHQKIDEQPHLHRQMPRRRIDRIERQRRRLDSRRARCAARPSATHPPAMKVGSSATPLPLIAASRSTSALLAHSVQGGWIQ